MPYLLWKRGIIELLNIVDVIITHRSKRILRFFHNIFQVIILFFHTFEDMVNSLPKFKDVQRINDHYLAATTLEIPQLLSFATLDIKKTQ